MWNKQLVRDAFHIQVEVVAISLMIFGAHMHIVFISNVKIFVFVKWSYRSTSNYPPPHPQSCVTTKLRRVIILWARNPITFKHMPFTKGGHSIVKLNTTCGQNKYTFGKLHHQNGSKFHQSFFVSRYTRYLLHSKKGNQNWGSMFLIKHTVSN